MESWYRDDNAVPPEYLLKPRSGAWPQPDWWQPLEPRLHDILLVAARTAGLSEEVRMTVEASAAHQEILKGTSCPANDIPRATIGHARRARQ